MAQGKNAHIEGLQEKLHNKIVDDTSTIDAVATSDLGELARDEKFMHEEVSIIIMSTTDPNAAPYVTLSVNGDRKVVYRNRKTIILRKHLEVLARMKETRWIQAIPEGYVGAVGAESLQGHTAHVYPFTVIQDKNPAGGAWLENIMAEAA